ncbi:MAG: peptide chain release factor N(5)-glutamine methyltransferase [Pseudomonadota bacterium]
MRRCLLAKPARLLLSEGALSLQKAGSPSPQLDAELLLADVLGRPRLEVLADLDMAVDDGAAAAFQAGLARRKAGEPVAHITGTTEFWSLPLKVSPDVLVPRPDSETLIEAVCARCDRKAPLKIADLGAGSGALSLALFSEFPLAKAVCVDISPSALALTLENAQALGYAERVETVCEDMAGWLQTAAGFDVLISNPPYLRSEEVAGAAPFTMEREPSIALDGGMDGLRFYRLIAEWSPSVIREGGLLCLEIGHDQAQSVTLLLNAAFSGIEVHKDLARRDRAVTARRHTP